MTDSEAGGEDGDNNNNFLSTSQVGCNNDENLSAKLMDPSPDMDPLQPHFNDIADTLNHRHHHHNDEEEQQQQHKDNEDFESDRYNSLSLEESSLTTTTTALSAHRSSSLVRGALPCAAYFFFEASISCVLPYLAVYYKELGFSTRTVGFLSSLGTFVSILGAPFWGAIADRTRKLSETMLITFSLGVTFRMSLLLAGANLPLIITATVLWSFCHSPVDTLLDSSVIGILSGSAKAHFGKFRSWSKFGNFVTSAIVGVFVYGGGFQWAFSLHALLAIPAVACMYAFRFQEASEDRRLIRREDVRLWDGLRLLCTHKRLLFSVVQILTAGISFGVVAAFAYVLLHERAKRDGREQGWDLTLCRTAMAVGAIAMYYLSGPLISKLGAYAIMTLSLGSLSLMFFTYSLVYYGSAPLVALTGMLVAEFLRGGTFAILWATVMVYIDSISPSGSNSTMMTIMESIFKGLGHTLGALLGGFLADTIAGGLGELFFLLGCAQLVVAILSMAISRCL